MLHFLSNVTSDFFTNALEINGLFLRTQSESELLKVHNPVRVKHHCSEI